MHRARSRALPLIVAAVLILARAGPLAAVTFTDAGVAIGGSKAAWGDFDGDGRVDLLAGGRVWRNQGGGAFREVASVSGDGIWGDFDNDGHLDIFCYSSRKLHRNEGDGTFSDVSSRLPELPMGNTRGAAWGDFNGDAFLDLYVGGYETPGYQPDAILMSDGGRRFTLAWVQSGDVDPSRGITAADFDEDGDLDVYVSNYRLEQNQLWRNDGKGVFTNAGQSHGVAGTDDGWSYSYGHTIGSAWGDLDCDGHLDLFVGNFSHPPAWQDRPRFYRNLGKEQDYRFEDRSGGAGLAWQESFASPALGDVDNDGFLDLFFTTVYPGDNSVLYHNDGDFRFSNVTASAGLGGRTGYQAAWADYDGDGDVDLATDGRLWRNGGTPNGWLAVRLRGDGVRVNSSAIGAQVRATVGGRTITRQVESGTGEGNQNDLTLHFGLGSFNGVVPLEIRWPDGRVEKTRSMANRLLEWSYSSESRLYFFEQGTGGYEGTVDTALLEWSPGSNRSRAPAFTVDADEPSDSGQSAQVLLRFEGIFAPEDGEDDADGGVRRIPPGAPIRSAVLEIDTADPGSGAAFHRMLKTWSDMTSWTRWGGTGIRPGVDALVEPDAVVAGTDGTVRVDVTASVAAWSRAPCSNHGWALLPTGTDGWDFSSAEGDSPPRLIVETLDPVRDDLVGSGATWRYLRGLEAPPAGWNQPDFVPGAEWLEGAAGIGYGDDDDVTVLDDMAGAYPSVFLRHRFRAQPLAARLTLRVDYDDGFVAWLNGVEAARSASLGVAGTPVAWNALAESREAGTWETFALDPSVLRAGDNVLAVQVHNASIDSSDLSFDAELFSSATLIGAGESWRYLPAHAPFPAGWTSSAFDDDAWLTGETGIGYGDDDDTTQLGEMRGEHLAVLCRKTFAVESPETLDDLVLTVTYDDGLVVHLNGEETARVNMPSGPIDHTTAALEHVESATAAISIAAAALVRGANVLAVSVHNASLASSDLSFRPVLGLRVFSEVGDCAPEFRRGDASGDGRLDVADAVKILVHLFRDADIACPDGADVDDDGAVAITDAISFLDFLFRGGAQPPAPGPTCGEDPTPDGLDPCVGTACAAAG